MEPAIFVLSGIFPSGMFKTPAGEPPDGQEEEVALVELMHDEELNDQDAREIAGIVDRYESMVASNASTFFDLMELEVLIEHYLQQLSLIHI